MRKQLKMFHSTATPRSAQFHDITIYVVHGFFTSSRVQRVQSGINEHVDIPSHWDSDNRLLHWNQCCREKLNGLLMGDNLDNHNSCQENGVQVISFSLVLQNQLMFICFLNRKIDWLKARIMSYLQAKLPQLQPTLLQTVLWNDRLQGRELTRTHSWLQISDRVV
jgi:hypothetical protein